MNVAVILAGGTGTRMGAVVPKQFLPLCGEPIIVHTVRRILECARFDKVVVAVRSDWRVRLQVMLADAGIYDPRILITSGGKERHDSIMSALKAIHDSAEVVEEDVVVIHDAVRPFVSRDILEASIDAASKYGACVATLPAVDTMLEIEDGFVKSVPPRSSLVHGQAPDSARILLLERALRSLTDEERKSITGTAQILVMSGILVRTIPGDPRNIKITTSVDMEIGERYMEAR